MEADKTAKKYDPKDWTKVLIPKTTHRRIQQIAEEDGMKIWAVIDKNIPTPEA